jgi:hypothetical protein
MIVVLRSSDIFEIWEQVMADISNGLKDKYGLRSAPLNSQIAAWAKETERLIEKGLPREQAGENAAKVIFPDYKSSITKSDADTIVALLEAAKNKKNG